MATKEHSYKNHPVFYKVSILGQDITHDVQNIEGIQTALDYPNINEFRVNEATITLQDPDDDYNPQKASNFYETNGGMITPPITQSGYRSTVDITAGFIVDGVEESDMIYSGQILNITKDAKTKDVKILCSDPSQQIRDEPVTDFGLRKKIQVESYLGTLHGNYPFFIGLTQPSEDSVSGTSGSITLDRKQTLRTEGFLEAKNFRETENGIETEGGPLQTNPDLTFRSPYRSRTVKSVVEKLLDKYGITGRNIQLPIASASGPYFSSLGRPEYETRLGDITETDPSVWQWSGGVTDMIGDEANNILYLLVSQTGSSIVGNPINPPRPKIIKWNLETDEREELIELRGASSTVEAWKFVAESNFTTFYVLGTDPRYIRSPEPGSSNLRTRAGYEFGSYDSSEYTDTINSKVKILRVNTASDPQEIIRYIDPALVNSNLLPQLAMHYHIGFPSTTSDSQNRFENRQGSLPDSRRNLYLDGTTLYYPYANRDQFGVAKATDQNVATSIIRADIDDDGFNTAGFDFWVDSTHVYFAFTNITGSNSRFRIIRGPK